MKRSTELTYTAGVFIIGQVVAMLFGYTGNTLIIGAIVINVGGEIVRAIEEGQDK